tara:strand:+ start:6271 stop:6933 length:663 start_codon:yes stop_codon:yes gene_type:complete
MSGSQTPEILETLSALVDLGDHLLINFSTGEICGAELNVKHRPSVEQFIPTIVKDLLDQVLKAGIEFDAVVGIPTGGCAWANEFARQVLAEKAGVYQHQLCKGDNSWEFLILNPANIQEGTRFIVVDDVIYNGQASRLVTNLLEAAGCEVVCFAFPVAVSNTGVEFWEHFDIPAFVTYDGAFIKNYLKKYCNEEGVPEESVRGGWRKKSQQRLAHVAGSG